MEPIAHIETSFPTKFGVPRQAGIVDLPARIIFEPQYRVAEAVRGIEGFDYLWLIWQFHQAHQEKWSPTVRPPRLGGNQRIGVFATRSPFRPNGMGLSSVKLIKTELHASLGPILHISGADLVDGTPILDIKPYLPYTDSHPEARSGFAPIPTQQLLEVVDSEGKMNRIPLELREPLIEVLAHDPRPQYQHDPERVYFMPFDQFEIRFKVAENIVTIMDIH